MKVFILGATGFIGLPVAQALVRAGHIVYGLARTPEKASKLAAEEIIPVIGDASDPSKWTHLIATIDLFIDAVGGMEVYKLSPIVLKAVTEAAEKRPAGSPKLSYIYTSGCWVHGDDRENIVTDTTPITKPANLVAWRPSLEQAIVKSTVLNGIVIRPSLVYGRAGSLVSILFGTAASGQVSWWGTAGARWSTIHTDDLANFYLLAAEKSSSIGGLIFDVANDATESLDDILAKVVKLTGANGFEYKQPTNPFEEALAVTNLVRPYLGRALLGWTARKASLVDGLEVYHSSWKALAGQ